MWASEKIVYVLAGMKRALFEGKIRKLLSEQEQKTVVVQEAIKTSDYLRQKKQTDIGQGKYKTLVDWG